MNLIGKVFYDTNANGYLDNTEVGIPNVYLVMRAPDGICTSVQTDLNGDYLFTNITVPGLYTIYETALENNTCPPSILAQPSGYINSSTIRVVSVPVTQEDINGNVTKQSYNFGHDNLAPFTCSSSYGYVVTVPPGFSNSRFVAFNVVTGLSTVINNNLGYVINAIGYSMLNHMIYGLILGTNQLVRISGDGTLTQFGGVANLPNSNYNTGTIDENGHLFVCATGTATSRARYYVIDVNENSVTFGQMVDPVINYGLDTAPYGTVIASPFYFGDWVYNPVNGMLYTTDIDNAIVKYVNPTTGEVSSVPTTGLTVGIIFGCLFIDSAGTMYGLNNGDGKFYRILITSTQATAQFFVNTLSSSNSDGASCIDAVIELDFGDAPDYTSSQGPGDYRTRLSSNGPRHQIINNLKLGSFVTAETDAYYNTTATADDSILNILDDGTTLPLPIMAKNQTSYTFEETVFNDTGNVAYLYAWIDYNKNGIFETKEGVVLEVPSVMDQPQQVTVTIPVPTGETLTAGNTFVRVRTTTQQLVNTGGISVEDTRSYGPAQDGEVEDYILAIEDTKVVIQQSSTMSYVDFSDQIVYTVTVTNPGTLPINNVAIQCNITPGTIYQDSFIVSTDVVGENPYSGIVVSTMNPSETITLSWQVQVENSLPVTNNIALTTTATIPNLQPISSTPLVIPVNHADLNSVGNVVKEVDKEYADLGDVVTYTFHLYNSGSVAAQHVYLQDYIPTVLAYQSGSLTVDGITTPITGPGSDIGSIAAKQTVTVVFQTVVVSIPTSNPISNQGTITYYYVTDPTNPVEKQEQVSSNTVTTYIYHGQIGAVKSSSKQIVTPGETITFTVQHTNSGNQTVTNVRVFDNLQTAIIFNPDSVRVDSVLLPTQSLEQGIEVGSIGPGVTKEVSFEVLIENQISDLITNQSSSTYNYQVSENRTITTSSSSNIISMGNLKAHVLLVKEANRVAALEQDRIQYVITITNDGQLPLESVTIRDLVTPLLEYESGVSIGGVYSSQSIVDGVTLTGFEIGQSVVISYYAKVIGIPGNGWLQNQVVADYDYQIPEDTTIFHGISEIADNSIRIYVPGLLVRKNSSIGQVLVGESYNYTIEVENIGNIIADMVTIIDQIPDNIVVDHILLDGGELSGNLTQGIQIGSLGLGQTKVITIIVTPQTTGVTERYYNAVKAISSIQTDPNMPTQLLEYNEVDEQGVIILGIIQGIVWVDTVGNGILPPGQQGINGIQVSLFDSNATLVDSIQTSTNTMGREGSFEFTNLPAGGYYLVLLLNYLEYKVTVQRLGIPNGNQANPKTYITEQIGTNQALSQMVPLGLLPVNQVQLIKDANQAAGKMLRNTIYSQLLLGMKLEEVITIKGK